MKQRCLGALLLCLSCHPAEKQTKTPSTTLVTSVSAPAQMPSETPVVPVKEKTFAEGTYVAIESDAVFYRAPREDTEKATMSFVFPRETPTKNAVVVRLHREVGEFFEVEPLTTEQNKNQCDYNTESGLMNISVKLFVKTSAALPVIARPVTFSYPDKTSIDLLEGVLAQPTARDTFIISDGVYSFESSLEPGSTERWFTLSKDRFKADSPELVREITQLVIGDKAFLEEQQSLWGKTVETKNKQRLFAFGTKCAKFQALLLSKNHQNLGAAFAGLSGDVPERKYNIASGASLYWSDGAKAGELKAKLSVENQSSSTTERSCFEVLLDRRDKGLFNKDATNPSSEKKYFVFCFDRKDVTVK